MEKHQEYAERGVPEYWILDPVASIALVLTLADDNYQERKFQGDEVLILPTFSELKVTAAQILKAGL
ncbi:MAG: Uma2 family endonuclease [Cyanobacteria bacterium J06554_1]